MICRLAKTHWGEADFKAPSARYQSGHDADAVARYARLAVADPADALFAERAGIAALRSGDTINAVRLLTSASRLTDASWRVWNALGVVGDRARHWPDADAAYAHALVLAERGGDP